MITVPQTHSRGTNKARNIVPRLMIEVKISSMS